MADVITQLKEKGRLAERRKIILGLKLVKIRQGGRRVHLIHFIFKLGKAIANY